MSKEGKNKVVVAQGDPKKPFTGLKAGVKYSYTRANWPAPLAGTEYETTEHAASAKEFPKVNEKGAIVNELRVQLNGVSRFYPLSELPADATFTEI